MRQIDVSLKNVDGSNELEDVNMYTDGIRPHLGKGGLHNASGFF